MKEYTKVEATLDHLWDIIESSRIGGDVESFEGDLVDTMWELERLRVHFRYMQAMGHKVDAPEELDALYAKLEGILEEPK